MDSLVAAEKGRRPRGSWIEKRLSNSRVGSSNAQIDDLGMSIEVLVFGWDVNGNCDISCFNSSVMTEPFLPRFDGVITNRDSQRELVRPCTISHPGPLALRPPSVALNSGMDWSADIDQHTTKHQLQLFRAPPKGPRFVLGLYVKLYSSPATSPTPNDAAFTLQRSPGA